MARDTDAVIQAVKLRLRALDWPQARLAREAGSDPNTISDFLNGVRWPRQDTRERIEQGLGWTKGHIDEIATVGEQPVNGSQPITHSGESPNVAGETPKVLFNWPPGALDGLTATEIAEIQAKALGIALEAAREIRQARRSS